MVHFVRLKNLPHSTDEVKKGLFFLQQNNMFLQSLMSIQNFHLYFHAQTYRHRQSLNV